MKKSLVASVLALGILGTAGIASADSPYNKRPVYRPLPAKKAPSRHARRDVTPPKRPKRFTPARPVLVKPVKRTYWWAPRITSLPSRAIIGKTFIVRGKNLPRNATLRIGNRVMKPVYASSTQLRFIVPRNLRPRTYRMALLGRGLPFTRNLVTLSKPHRYRRAFTWAFDISWLGHFQG